jgi:glycosyltransferase involved in cell wall biosynthesis
MKRQNSGEKPKMVFIIDSGFPSYSGGREKLLYEYCKRLQSSYAIDIIAMKSRGKEFYPLSTLNVRLYKLPSFGMPFSKNKSSSYIFSLFSFSLIASVFVFIKYFFSRNNTIFITEDAGHMYIPIIFLRGKRFKRIVWTHGCMVNALGRIEPRIKPIIRILQSIACNDADLILASGWNNYELLKPISRNIKVIPNGVDLRYYIEAGKKYEPARNYNQIVSIANLSPIRGIDELISSVPYIKAEYSGDFKIIFVGGGDIERYTKMAEEMLCSDNVEFVGAKDNVPEYLWKSGISCCLQNPDTKDGEGGISLASIESMAAGCAIVAWDSKQYRQILKHGYSGHLIQIGNVKELGKCIAFLLNNKEYLKELGANALIESKKYDFDALVKEFEKLI